MSNPEEPAPVCSIKTPWIRRIMLKKQNNL